jgi:hypothetical protein
MAQNLGLNWTKTGKKPARARSTIRVMAEVNNPGRVRSTIRVTREANNHDAARKPPFGVAETNAAALHIAAAGFRTVANGQSNQSAAPNNPAADDDPMPGLADSARRGPCMAQAYQRTLAKKDARSWNPAPGGGQDPNFAGVAWTLAAVRNGCGKTETVGAPWQNLMPGVDRNRGFVGAGQAKLNAAFDSRESDHICARPGSAVAPRCDQPMMADVIGGVGAGASAQYRQGASAERNG